MKRALGEYLSEPKANVWFDGESPPISGPRGKASGYRLDRRTKMLLDDAHVFINGESSQATGRDAALLKQFANERRVGSVELTRASVGAKSLLEGWRQVGWIHHWQEP